MNNTLLAIASITSLLVVQFILLAPLDESEILLLWLVHVGGALLYSRWLASHSVQPITLEPGFTICNPSALSRSFQPLLSKTNPPGLI
jgi:hypothetical protein